MTVKSGETWLVAATMRLDSLNVEEGGTLAIADGYSLTLDRVETGSALTETGGTVTAIVVGTYRGDVALTVAEQTR